MDNAIEVHSIDVTRLNVKLAASPSESNGTPKVLLGGLSRLGAGGTF